MADQQFCLRWNNHQSTLISVFDTLLENGTLVDCTLAAEGQYLKAHKVVLSACSPYLETLLSQHYEKHPIVILKDVKFTELKSMMDYMYRGEVNISQDQLGTFLKAAESLQIKGLSDNAEGDARDVGSTPKGAPPPKRTAQPAPPVQPQRPESPAHRDGSISPSSRKRRRIRRGSQGEDSNMGDSHLDANSCDLPSQAQSTPIVPNIPSSISTTIKTPIVKPEQTELVNRIDTSNLNSLPPESGLLKEKIEPISEPLLEPKTEYLDDSINDDNVEDLTLDDDDDMDMSNMSSVSNMSRPGPSHGNDVSQGFAPWQLGGNQSGTDEVFMAAQEAVNAHRDSQDKPDRLPLVKASLIKPPTVEPPPVEPPLIKPPLIEPDVPPPSMSPPTSKLKIRLGVFCNICGSRTKENDLVVHKDTCPRSSGNQEEFKCSCGKELSSQQYLSMHRMFCSTDKERAKPKHKCACGKDFKSKSFLLLHATKCDQKKDEGLDRFICKCGRKFKSNKGLHLHKCRYCLGVASSETGGVTSEANSNNDRDVSRHVMETIESVVQHVLQPETGNMSSSSTLTDTTDDDSVVDLLDSSQEPNEPTPTTSKNPNSLWKVRFKQLKRLKSASSILNKHNNRNGSQISSKHLVPEQRKKWSCACGMSFNNPFGYKRHKLNCKKIFKQCEWCDFTAINDIDIKYHALSQHMDCISDLYR